MHMPAWQKEKSFLKQKDINQETILYSCLFRYSLFLAQGIEFIFRNYYSEFVLTVEPWAWHISNLFSVCGSDLDVLYSLVKWPVTRVIGPNRDQKIDF